MGSSIIWSSFTCLRLHSGEESVQEWIIYRMLSRLYVYQLTNLYVYHDESTAYICLYPDKNVRKNMDCIALSWMLVCYNPTYNLYLGNESLIIKNGYNILILFNLIFCITRPINSFLCENEMKQSNTVRDANFTVLMN